MPTNKTPVRSRGKAADEHGHAVRLASIFGIVFFCISLSANLAVASVGATSLLSSYIAEALHDACDAAARDLNLTIIKNSDTECIYKKDTTSGSITTYIYFSGENECTRSVIVIPNSPGYDRTTCQPVVLPENTSQETYDLEQAQIYSDLEKVEEAVRLVGKKVEYVEGTVQLLKDTGTVPVTKDLAVDDGDVVLTGKTGFVDIISDGGATWLSGDSEVGFTGVKEPGRVIAPDEPLDPQNFQLEELSWWQKVSLYFAGTYNPDVYKTADDLYKKARVVYRGAAYFDEKTDGTSTPAMVVTPTAAIVPNGTSFLVEVAKDGETTVTTLSGSVVVADLKSGKTVSVGVNQAITIPKTPDGLSAKELQQGLTTVIIKPIDAWWLEKTNEMSVLAAKEAAEAGGRANQAVAQAFNLKNKIFFASLIGLFIVVLIVISVMRSKAARKK